MSDRPTSPVTPPNNQTPSVAELKAVLGDDAPAEMLAEARAAPAATLRGEWQRVLAFLRRPTLDVSEQSAAPLTVLGRIYLLDMLAMLVLVICASIAVAAGVYLPRTALAEIEFTWVVVLAVIIGAPVFEELAFRSWLSGKPGHVIALFAVGAGATGYAAIHTIAPIVGAILMIAGIVGAIVAIITLANRTPMGWFARYFPIFFWLSTLAFALVHIFNFQQGSLAVLLPLVLPQFVLGGLLGYIRVRIGLSAAIVLHALHNATALGISALAGEMGG